MQTSIILVVISPAGEPTSYISVHTQEPCDAVELLDNMLVAMKAVGVAKASPALVDLSEKGERMVRRLEEHFKDLEPK